jgi:hypothetical protein
MANTVKFRIILQKTNRNANNERQQIHRIGIERSLAEDEESDVSVIVLVVVVGVITVLLFVLL